MIGPESKDLRDYGDRGHPFPEDPARCIARVSSDFGWHSRQCSRKRGKGLDGLYCGTHARSDRGRWEPEPGSYLRNLLTKAEKERDAAKAKFEDAQKVFEACERSVRMIQRIIG